jgi:hypothetical protein
LLVRDGRKLDRTLQISFEGRHRLRRNRAMNRHLVSGLFASVGALGSAVGAYGAADEMWAPANSPAIRYEGRYVSDSSGAVRLGFPGVTVHLRYQGPGLSLRTWASSDGVWFDVVVDDAAPTRLHLHEGEGDYVLLPTGAAAEHTVALVRCTESWQGACSLRAFDPGHGGRLLALSSPPPRRLMFVGDSVTCGERAAFEPARAASGPETSNARLSYGMILARRLGTQCHLVSYGGRGMIRDWQGIRDTRNAPQFYELALPDEPGTFWDHRLYVPDVIGIQLGTNDFSQGIPDQNEFINGYVEFVRKVRRDAPDATIFLMDSPIVTDDPVHGPRRSALHAYLELIVRRVDSPKVMLAPIAHYHGVPGNGHPTGAEHEAIAGELEPLFRRALEGR